MKKLVLLLSAIALVSSVAMAQVQLSDIYGTVVLPDGSAVPGVTVTLTGDVIGKMTTVTSEEGNFRFLKLNPGNYDLKFELEGFKTVIRKGIRTYLGKNITLTIPMETTTIQEEVVVTAKAGIVDTRKTSVGMNVSKEMLQSLPTARNPWTVMSLVPGLMIDRVDVGGADSGQQSNYIAGGASKDDSTWNVDGANITDPSAIGSAPAYLNVNAYEELQVTVGATDITAQTGGVQLNFVTKKAGNRNAGDFHLYVSDKAWEMTKALTPYQAANHYVTPGINRLYQYGINFGGPIVKDKWFWIGSWAIQDVHGRTLTGDEDATLMLGAYLKTNFQLGNTTGELHMTYDNKQKWGRTVLSSAQQNNGSLLDQTGPGWVFYGALQQIFGNLMLELKGAYTDGGFILDPRGANINPADGHNEGKDWQYIYSPRKYLDSLYHYITNRNMIDVALNGNYFAEGVIGADHEIRFGFDYNNADTTTQSLYPNQRVCFTYLEAYPSAYQTVWLLPDWYFDVNFTRMSAYVSDTATWGKLTVNLGVRYDKEQGKTNGITMPAFTWYEPGSPYNGTAMYTSELGQFTVPAGVKAAAYKVISPRLSFTYDITGDGKNVVKLSLARYGGQSGNNLIYNIYPHREIDVYWYDNGDFIPQYDELGGIAWRNTNLVDYSTGLENVRYSSDFNSPLLDELTLSYEKQLGEDLAIGLTGFYKKQHNLSASKGIMADGSIETKDNWYFWKQITTGSVKSDVYARHEEPVGTYYYNWTKAYNRYLAGQLTLTKKLSNKWMADMSFVYLDWTQKRYAEETLNMTNFDYFNDCVVAPETSGSGLSGIYINARWQFKLSGLYQLPWGVNITGMFQAREGYVIPYYASASSTPGGVGTQSVYESNKKFGDDRLPTFWILNLGLEKTFKISDTTSATLFVDGYNITNNQITLKVNNSLTSASKDQALMVTNAGNFQFGIRVNF
jgi:hypothetical protein